MAPSFHSKIAQHVVELELAELAKRNPSLGAHPDTQQRIDWEMLNPGGKSAPTLNQGSHSVPLFPDDLPSRIPSRPSDSAPMLPHKKPITDPVAIIGAGAAGLRIAMMLKHLGIPYRVFEASERFGGRIFTYHFKKGEREPESTQNYFDVGAMRFPDNAANARTFDLFKELGITKEGGSGGKLLPYNLSTKDNILLFNDIKKTVAEISDKPLEDHFNDGVSNGGLVPDEYIKKTYVKPNKDKLYGVEMLAAG